MGYRDGDEVVVIEGKVSYTTAKAHLVELLNTENEVWLPKSQIVSMSDPDMDGNREIRITEWIAKKNGLI